MITVRQIERHWKAKAYDRLFAEVTTARPEASLPLGIDLARPLPAASMAVIRLDELDQSHSKLCPELIRSILRAQESDGGWGDLITTALCLRALLCSSGGGPAIERGLQYLAALQQEGGIWPSIPIRRMPADPSVSALVLYELGEHARFRRAVRFADAVRWFIDHERAVDEPTRQLWGRVQMRCRIPVPAAPSLC